jgi:hypothetical protein
MRSFQDMVVFDGVGSLTVRNQFTLEFLCVL